MILVLFRQKSTSAFGVIPTFNADDEFPFLISLRWNNANIKASKRKY